MPDMPASSPAHPAVAGLRITRVSAGNEVREKEDDVAVEEPLELRVEGRPVAVMMRTPGHDDELAAGFLLSEAIIKSRQDVFEIRHCPSVGGASPENVIDALLVRANKADLKRLTRHVFTASSCGICGKASIESVHQNFPPIESNAITVPASVIRSLPTAIGERQEVFQKTGGLHAAAIFDLRGRLKILREDVGRHNAVDKILGRALLDGLLPLDKHILFVSGRLSFEIMQKALAARVPIVAGISAPTSLAVDFARESGQTLAAFVRATGMNIYAGAERISTRGAPRKGARDNADRSPRLQKK